MTRLLSSMRFAAVLTALGMALPCAQAVQAPVVPRALLPVVEAGFRVIRHFPAVSELTGWIVSGPAGGEEVLYTTADGKTVIAGILSNENGENLTRRYADLYESAPDLSNLWPAINSSFQVTEGSSLAHARRQIWVIMDPNCSFCHQLWVELKPYEKAGLVVHWIPVGILFPSSTPRAAAVLAGGTKALYIMESRFDAAHERGGAPGIKLTPRLQHELAVNLSLAMKAGIQGTPGIFYRDAGGKLKLQQGMPSASVLAEITGMPPAP